MSDPSLAAKKKKNVTILLNVRKMADLVLYSKNSEISVTVWDKDQIRLEADITVKAKNATEAQDYLDKIIMNIDSTGNIFTVTSNQPYIKPVIREKSFAERLFGSTELSIFISYRIWVPVESNISVYASKGSIRMQDIKGKIHAETTEKEVELKNMSGSVSAHTTNAKLKVEMTTIDSNGLELTTTNADITVEVPRNALITYQADAFGGEIVSDLRLFPRGPFTKQSQYGWINGAGVYMRLFTTNGRINIRGS